MSEPSFKGFLIVDGSKNTLLIPKEEVIDKNLSMDEIIARNIKYAKKHKNMHELSRDLSLYFKCQYENVNGLQSGRRL